MSTDSAEEAKDRSFLRHYGELREVARSLLDPSRKDPTLGASALVNEAWLRLAGSHGGRDLPPEDYISYAYHAIKEIGALIEEQKTRAKKYSW